MAVSYNKLWKILIDKKMNKKQLAVLAGVSAPTLTKMAKDENVNTEILVRICKSLNVNIGDIIDVVPDGTDEY